MNRTELHRTLLTTPLTTHLRVLVHTAAVVVDNHPRRCTERQGPGCAALAFASAFACGLEPPRIVQNQSSPRRPLEPRTRPRVCFNVVGPSESDDVIRSIACQYKQTGSRLPHREVADMDRRGDEATRISALEQRAESVVGRVSLLIYPGYPKYGRSSRFKKNTSPRSSLRATSARNALSIR